MSCSPATDSFVTCNAALELESYRYGVLAAAGGGKEAGARGVPASLQHVLCYVDKQEPGFGFVSSCARPWIPSAPLQLWNSSAC